MWCPLCVPKDRRCGTEGRVLQGTVLLEAEQGPACGCVVTAQGWGLALCPRRWFLGSSQGQAGWSGHRGRARGWREGAGRDMGAGQLNTPLLPPLARWGEPGMAAELPGR